MLVLDSVPKELPTSLFHLKHVSLKEMRLVDDGLRFLFALMKCSPNLEKVSLELNYDWCYKMKICSGIFEEYSDVSLEHLKELDIVWFWNLKPEMDFLKFVLARSPKLKKVCLLFMADSVEEELEMQRVLLRAPRASPVEIDLKWMGQRPPKCLFPDL
ncbi:hypothetical protein SSX86_002456 [Deinandra increscens subsp. villosa]|uniref:FBD domain-containing protein n=1 Tax=Deinandra increscens subsp. villosa TaxID=3103831 RepID=A0AAP0DWF8_9ASTR